jgi:hypothetical protein
VDREHGVHLKESQAVVAVFAIALDESLWDPALSIKQPSRDLFKLGEFL